MSEPTAPGNQPRRRRSTQGAEAFIVTPFMRLARTHVLSVGGDTLVTIALAGSLFFSVTPEAARGRVALYLALTVAPFAVVGPLIGPAIDRAKGGRRMMMMIATFSRAIVAIVMWRYIDSLLLYPAAFTMLVLGKAYHVSKSAIVPVLVKRESEFVEANSKLAVLGGVASATAFIPGALMQLLSAGLPLLLACVVFFSAGMMASKLPSQVVATAPADALEKSELRGAGIVLGASAMALLRGMVGFVTFLLVFWLRASEAEKVWFGVIGVFGVIGNLGGAIAAPVIRRMLREERILGGVLVVSAVVAFFAAASPSKMMAALVALSVGLSTSLGKLAFDAIVQRDAPDANQGRSFARFETRFQMAWVIAALVPVIGLADLPIQVGFMVLAISASLGAFFYLGGLRAVAKGSMTPGDRLKQRVLTDSRVRRLRARVTSMGRGETAEGENAPELEAGHGGDVTDVDDHEP